MNRYLCKRNENRTADSYELAKRAADSYESPKRRRGGEKRCLNCKQSTVTSVPSVLSLLLDGSALYMAN